MTEYNYYIVQPLWRRPFLREPAHQRHLFYYQIIRRPYGAPWDEVELVSSHWTWKQALGVVRMAYQIQRANREKGNG